MRKIWENGVIRKMVFTLAALFPVIFVLCLLSARAVFAGDTRPCAKDLAQFCKDVRPGGGRIISCLKEHEGELTSLCKDKLQEVQKTLQDAKRACADDIEKFCNGIQEGEGRIARCLGGHSTKLSSECAKYVEFVKTKMKGK